MSDNDVLNFLKFLCAKLKLIWKDGLLLWVEVEKVKCKNEPKFTVWGNRDTLQDYFKEFTNIYFLNLLLLLLFGTQLLLLYKINSLSKAINVNIMNYTRGPLHNRLPPITTISLFNDAETLLLNKFETTFWILWW